jgi:hypothetical protein
MRNDDARKSMLEVARYYEKLANRHERRTIALAGVGTPIHQSHARRRITSRAEDRARAWRVRAAACRRYWDHEGKRERKLLRRPFTSKGFARLNRLPGSLDRAQMCLGLGDQLHEHLASSFVLRRAEKLPVSAYLVEVLFHGARMDRTADKRPDPGQYQR